MDYYHLCIDNDYGHLFRDSKLFIVEKYTFTSGDEWGTYTYDYWLVSFKSFFAANGDVDNYTNGVNYKKIPFIVSKDFDYERDKLLITDLITGWTWVSNSNLNFNEKIHSRNFGDFISCGKFIPSAHVVNIIQNLSDSDKQAYRNALNIMFNIILKYNSGKIAEFKAKENKRLAIQRKEEKNQEIINDFIRKRDNNK